MRRLLVLPLGAALLGVGGVLFAALAAPAIEGGGKQGLNLAAILMFFAFVLTGIYVQRANSRFDDLNRDLTKEVA